LGKKERFNAYEGVTIIDKGVDNHQDNVKMIVLHNKWKYVFNDNSDDEPKCQNKKGKIKKKDKRSDSEDENNDPHKPKKISKGN
jgi:hypothetical protein